MLRITINFAKHVIVTETEFQQVIEITDLGKDALREYVPSEDFFNSAECFTFDFDLSQVSANIAADVPVNVDYMKHVMPVYFEQIPGLMDRKNDFFEAIGMSEDIRMKAEMFDLLYESLHSQRNW